MTIEISNNQIKRTKDVFLKRFALIDFLRGFCMFLVIFDHIMWNFGYFFTRWAIALNDTTSVMYYIGQFASFYWSWALRDAVRFFALGTFVLLSGISVAFSKDNYKRTLELLALVFALTLVSNMLNAIWPAGSAINFNILAVLGYSLLVYTFVCKKSYRSILATLLILFIFEYTILPILEVYLKDSNALLIPLWKSEITINGQTYFEADYMPLFPYILFFFLGVLISMAYYFPRMKRKELGKHYDWQRPFCFLGRHSLIVYMTHQIIFQGIFMAIGSLCGLPL